MIVATFAAEVELTSALQEFRAARIGPLETYTPAAPRDEPIESPIPLIVLLVGLAAGIASFLLQSYSTTIGYRFDIGGRPQIAWASFIPTTFENAALLAIVAGFVSFMAINRMPRLYDPVDEAVGMRRTSQDRWVLQVASEDRAVLDRARRLLLTLQPVLVEELPG